jgi:hypothetical protein
LTFHGQTHKKKTLSQVQLELDDSTMHFGDNSQTAEQRLTPEEEPQMELRQIEQQKLQVMRELLKVETKRLKVEKKRLKVERMRLQIDLQGRIHPSPAAYKT